MKRKFHYTLFADTESSGEKMYERNGRVDTFLLGWSDIHDDTDNVAKTTNIKDFFESIKEVYSKGKNKKNIVVYFHNLSWDFLFFIDYFKRNNIDYKALISDTKKIFTAEVKLTGRLHLTFLCSYLNSGVPLSQLPLSSKTVGDFDYNKDFTNFKLEDFSSEELNYLDQDVLSGKRYIKEYTNNGNNHYLTIASKSWSEMKEYLNPWDNPALLTNDFMRLRPWYRGGLTVYNEEYLQKEIKKPIYYVDINSSYPYILRNFPLPIGMPIEHPNNYWWKTHKVEFKESHLSFKPLVLMSVYFVEADIKKGKIPWVDFDATPELLRFNVGNAKRENSNVLLRCTREEFYQIKEDYDCIYEIREIIGFNGRVGELRPYIDKYMELKEISPKDSFERNNAKLMLNGPTGKFGQNPTHENIDSFNEDWSINESSSTTNEKTNYLPKGIFMTAFARLRVVDLMNNVIGAENYLSGDTDSIMTLLTPEQIIERLPQAKMKHWFHKTELGAWDLEMKGDFCFIAGKKKYMMKDKDKIIKVAFNGLRDSSNKIKEPQDFFKTHENKKRKLVTGGPYIKTSEFTLKGGKEYIESLKLIGDGNGLEDGEEVI